MWFYVQHVLIAYQLAQAASLGTPRGNLSDLYPRWLGARELLLHHRDPYSLEVTREIQAGYYGRELNSLRPNEPSDQQAFAYPAYVVFVLAPAIFLPFSVVQPLFFLFLFAISILSVLLWLRALRWRPTPIATATIAILAVGSFPVLQGLKLEQLTLLVAGLVAACAVLIAENHLFAAGMALAFATVKPQLTLLLAMWLIVWTLGDWKHRQRFFWGFFLTMAALILGAEAILPGWIGEFGRAIVAYRQYTGGAQSILQLLTGTWWASVIIVLAFLIVCWRGRAAPSGSARFDHLTVLGLAATVVIVPKTAPYNQVLLIPGVLFLIAYRKYFFNTPLRRATALISAFCIAWPWLAALALTGASAVLPQASVQQAWALPLYSTFATPLAVTLLLVFCSNLRQAVPST